MVINAPMVFVIARNLQEQYFSCGTTLKIFDLNKANESSLSDQLFL